MSLATSISLLFEILLSIGAAVILMSFIEYFFHAYLMHRRVLPESLYRRVPAFDRLYREHALGHHVRYHATFEEYKDSEVYEGNLEIKFSNALIGTLIALPFLILYWIYVSPVFPIILTMTLFLGRLVWNKVHREMHHPKRPWWAQSGIFKFLVRHHFIHHQRSDKNFNVMIPFADYVLRSSAGPTEAERDKMSILGFLLK